MHMFNTIKCFIIIYVNEDLESDLGSSIGDNLRGRFYYREITEVDCSKEEKVLRAKL